MKILKIDLHITGTMLVDDKEETPASVEQTTLFKDEEMITENQTWFLRHNSTMMHEDIDKLTKSEAIHLIADIKRKTEEPKEVASPIELIVKKRIADEQQGIRSNPLPWEAKLCSVEGCGRKAVTKGMCHKHYQQELKNRKKGMS